MSEPGYTYTTLSGGPDEPVRVRVSFYLDSAAWIRVPGVAEGKPHLVVEHGDVSVSFSPSPGDVSAEDARLARELADRAAEYAAVIERLGTASATAPETGAEVAAGDPAA
jgi:hypothetical protein